LFIRGNSYKNIF